MTTWMRVLAVVVVSCSFGGHARSADASGPRRLKAVLWVGGFAHDFDQIAEILGQELPKRIPIDITVVNDGSFLDAPATGHPDVILMNHCFENTDGVLSPTQQEKLLSLIRGGTGVVGIHASYYSFTKWAAIRDLWGATFTQHGRSDVKVTVTMTDRKHEITKPLPESFVVTTELYQSTALAPDCRLLARAKEEGGDRDWPSVWTRMYGKGRVVVILPAHFPEAYRNSDFEDLIANSAMWAARMPVPGRRRTDTTKSP